MPLSTSNFEYTTTNIPAFLSKLWTLVEDPKYDELIAWDPAGFSFHVFDQTRFSREILPRFFKHNNMASFIRQLNMYGFRKVNSIDHGSLKSEKEDMEFHHPYFMRGKEQFLEFIKRKVPDLKMVNQPVNSISSSPNPSNNSSALQIQYPQLKTEELTKVLDDVNSMKSRQKLVDDSIFNMKKENEALWKEIASLRQKHHHQQQIVNKLIHFLVHLVNPSSLGLKRTRPLMIDSHAASKFAHLGKAKYDNDHNEFPDLDDTIGNGTGTDGKQKSNMNPSRTIIDNDDEDDVVEDDDDNDDDHFLITTSTNNGKSRHQIVEIEDYDDHASTAATTRISNQPGVNHRLGQQIDHIGNVVDGGRFQEIETINRNKTMQSGSNNGVSKKTTRGEFAIVEQDDGANESLVGDGVPLAKRLKPEDTASSELASNRTQSIDLNHQVENNNGKNSDAFLAYPNMFLNTPASGPVPTSSSSLPVELVNNNNNNNNNNTVPATGPATPINLSTPQASNSPIVTTPGSPSLDLAKINGDTSSTSVVDGNTSSAAGMPVTKTESSSNTMNDYVESLQLDLNSIKEFLTQNSFNTIDPYTINNLFSPIVLDQMDNESVPFYLEGPTDTTPNSNDRNNTWSHAGEITANAGVSGVNGGIVGSNDPSTN